MLYMIFLILSLIITYNVWLRNIPLFSLYTEIYIFAIYPSISFIFRLKFHLLKKVVSENPDLSEYTLEFLVFTIPLYDFRELFLEFYRYIELSTNKCIDEVKSELKNSRYLNKHGDINKIIKSCCHNIIFTYYNLSGIHIDTREPLYHVILKLLLRKDKERIDRLLNKLCKRPNELRNFLAHAHKDRVKRILLFLLNMNLAIFWSNYLEVFLSNAVKLLEDYRKEQIKDLFKEAIKCVREECEIA